MPLSDMRARSARPKTKPYKMADGEGLFLLITPAGGKYWRLRYFVGGKEKLLALGVYPGISLATARERRAEAQKALALGNDPSEVKKHRKRQALLISANTFGAIAREWHSQHTHKWKSITARACLNRLQTHVFPRLEHLPIVEITATEILLVLRGIEAKMLLETARRMMQACRKIFMYAIATGRVERNPVPDLGGALKVPIVKHRTYLTANELPGYLIKLDSYEGDILTRLALQLILLTFVRTGELRGARWTEVDWDKSEWRIPAERMKMKQLHIVPLSSQSLAALQKLREIAGSSDFIFPNDNNPKTCMSENTMLYALYRMGYHSRATVHGFRSTASTILNENGFIGDVIERQLAHSERDHVRSAYNHAQYLPERQRMMQWWADFLDSCRASAQPKST